MAKAYALAGTTLVRLDTADPAAGTPVTISGVAAAETLAGIDIRPQNGLLYGFGVNSVAGTATLYAISVRTGVATAVGGASQVAFVDTGGNPVGLPDPSTGYGVDFDPVSDRLRIETAGLNFRVDPNTGQPEDGDTIVLNGTNPDVATPGGTANVVALAYGSNAPNSATTTIYRLDAVTNGLYTQNPQELGPQTLVGTVTLGGGTLDFSNVTGFDIEAGDDGTALAALTVGGVTSLYRIDLASAVASLLASLPAGTSGLAVQSDQGGIPAVALSADGLSLLRLNTGMPTLATTVALILTDLRAGERLVALDYRPATGQLYALGVDASANTGTLYLVDPQSGGVTAIGAKGQIQPGIDLPDPDPAAGGGYGFDFNPAVDVIRVTTSNGFNLRLDPDTGAVVGVDSNVNGLPAGSAGVSAAAYTNSFGQQLGGGGPTTLYTLDATSDSLFIQDTPNAGTQTSRLAITLGGGALDFTDVNGFDIPAAVQVAAGGSPAPSGFGYAVLTVANVQGLYRIALATGASTLLGSVGPLGTPLAGLALADALNTPPVIATPPTATVAEGTAITLPLAATDADGTPSPIQFAITGGADAALFSLNGNTLTAAARNFETQAPTLQVQVTSSDGLDSVSQLITVSIANVAPTQPVDADAAQNRVVEGAAAGTAVGITAASFDPAGGPLSYGLTNSANGAFSIDAATGVVTVADPSQISFAAAPGGTFAITAAVTDGTALVAQNFQIALGFGQALPAFRFFDPRTGDHFYTVSPAERDQLLATNSSYVLEGIPWATPQKGLGTTDVFRFFDRTAGDHFYTTSAVERDTIIQTRADMSFEGVAFQAYAGPGRPGTFQLERFFNTLTGDHHFAASAAEAAGINAGSAGPGWVDEGPGFTVAMSGAFVV